MSDEDESDAPEYRHRLPDQVMGDKPKSALTRSICFRLLAGLLGTLFVTVAIASPIVFLFYAVYGEHLFVYRLLGIRQSARSQQPVSASDSSDLPSPRP
jgi:hypothetical protein